MEKANAAASKAYVATNNSSNNLQTLDLHGLQVKEAIAQTDARIAECKRKGLPNLTVIVGRGSHSAGGVSKLKPAITQLMNKHGFSVTPDVPNEGCLFIEFDGKKQYKGFWGNCNIM